MAKYERRSCVCGHTIKLPKKNGSIEPNKKSEKGLYHVTICEICQRKHSFYVGKPPKAPEPVAVMV